ncbi:hypothetical protein P8452_35754 [Trifolium repens]|nr:hypothetical protein P8452_35754 [Trifolium repens]
MKGVTSKSHLSIQTHAFQVDEILLGKQLPREKIQLATKFGISRGQGSGFTGMTIKGSPDYVCSCCEASLKRLGVEYIDLYYQHRVDTSVPIEDTVKDFFLCQTYALLEWSLWTREIEDEIVPLCRELGIGIVTYSPLGRGFFGGKGVLENVSAASSLL